MINAETELIDVLIGQQENPTTPFTQEIFDAITKDKYIQPKGISERIVDLCLRDTENVVMITEHKGTALPGLKVSEIHSANHSTAIIVTNADYMYYGHVYVKKSCLLADTVEVVGIRTSLLNMHKRTMHGIAHKIFAGVMQWATNNGLVHVQVLTPLGPMSDILSKLGFVIKPEFKETGYMFVSVAVVIDRLPTPMSYEDYGCTYPYVARKTELLDNKEFQEDCDRMAAQFKVASDKMYTCMLLRYSAEPYNNIALSYTNYLQFGYMNNLFTAATCKRICDVMSGTSKEKLCDITE
jgi:hypothetical protein